MKYKSQKIAWNIACVIYDNFPPQMFEFAGKYATKNTFAHGVNTLLTTIITWGTIYFLGKYFNILEYALTYMASYLLLRYRFGGSHFENPYICYIVTAGLPILAGIVTLKFQFGIGLMVLSTLVALISAIQNRVKDSRMYAKKNPIKKKARQDRFFKEGMILLTLITIVEIVLLINGFSNFAEASSLGKLVLFINLYF